MANIFDLDAFDTMRLKRRVKLALEELQEQIRRTEGLHKRPALSEVVQRLLDLAAVQSTDPAKAAKTQSFNPRNARYHKLLEVILEGANDGTRSAIIKNLRALAYTTTVAGPKSEEELDHDLDILIENLEKEQAQHAEKKNLSQKRRRIV
jgi:hypothetical protein